VYPGFSDVFRAFKECPLEDLKVVVLTNNSYIKESDGLAFSAREKTPVLDKIFHAIEEDVADGLYLNRVTDLGRLAEQGILLLNMDLTVNLGDKIDHISIWKPFMNNLFLQLRSIPGLIFVLIGKQAQEYEIRINEDQNDIYLLEHPMNAVINKRPWRHKSVFSEISRISKFLNNKEIQWT
jgi:uracil-DNA glycosylase